MNLCYPVSGTVTVDRSVRIGFQKKSSIWVHSQQKSMWGKDKLIRKTGGNDFGSSLSDNQIEEDMDRHSLRLITDNLDLQQHDIYTSRKDDFDGSLSPTCLTLIPPSMRPLMCCIFKPVSSLLSKHSPVCFRVYTYGYFCVFRWSRMSADVHAG